MSVGNEDTRFCLEALPFVVADPLCSCRQRCRRTTLETRVRLSRLVISAPISPLFCSLFFLLARLSDPRRILKSHVESLPTQIQKDPDVSCTTK